MCGWVGVKSPKLYAMFCIQNFKYLYFVLSHIFLFLPVMITIIYLVPQLIHHVSMLQHLTLCIHCYQHITHSPEML